MASMLVTKEQRVCNLLEDIQIGCPQHYALPVTLDGATLIAHAVCAILWQLDLGSTP